MSKPNEFISQASHIVRGAAEGWQENAIETLKAVTTTQWGENVIALNPLYQSILSTLAQDDISREERVQLITDIESLHSFDGMSIDALKQLSDHVLELADNLPNEDENAIDILLFTEVGSEGLDYQFCNLMINYDLPWNPMRIEQRIGRIDRRGQTSDVVNIYNMITKGTVDADIYERCLMRIGVFERSIGACEAILGQISTEVEKIALNTKLTDEERRFKLEQMADNEVRRIQEMNRLEDEEKGLFGFDLSNYTMTKEIQTAESPWLTPRSLQYLVERYLNDRLGKANRIVGESEIKTLRLSASDRVTLRQDFNRLSRVKSSVKRNWEAYLKGTSQFHKITFDPEAAKLDGEAFFITAVHPLVKQAAMYYATNEVSYINLKSGSDIIAPGKYPFAVHAWNYVGINPRFKLVTICKDRYWGFE